MDSQAPMTIISGTSAANPSPNCYKRAYEGLVLGIVPFSVEKLWFKNQCRLELQIAA
jgi:hypothetical protein